MHNLIQLERPVKGKHYGRPASVIFEIFIYVNLLIWVISYSRFNVQELLLLILLPVGCAFWIIGRGLAKKIPSQALNLAATILFVLVFDKVDNTNISRVIPMSIMEIIPVPTAFLSIVVLAYIINMLSDGLYVVHLSRFNKMFALACISLLISASLLFLPLYLKYDISFQPNFQLATKMVKFCLIILLFQEFCDPAFMKRFTITVALSAVMIEILNLIL